jgi:hypothetical protein
MQYFYSSFSSIEDVKKSPNREGFRKKCKHYLADFRGQLIKLIKAKKIKISKIIFS